MASGRCPKCEKLISYVKFEPVDLKEGWGMQVWRGVSYLCPSCSTVLSISIDPVALTNDVVGRITKELKRR